MLRDPMSQLSTVKIPAPSRFSSDRVIVGAFEDREVDVDLSPGLLEALRKELPKAWSAKKGYQRTCLVGKRVVEVHGLGPADRVSARDLDSWLASTLKRCRGEGCDSVAVCLPRHAALSDEAGAERMLRIAALSSYRFASFKGKKARGASKRRAQVVSILPGAELRSLYRRRLDDALCVARGVVLSRDLANTPPNQATPAWMASQARSLARRYGMKSRVLTPRELAREGFGGILAVGAGSAHPPRLVRLEWGTRGPVVALVGKGIVFDTGGISLKPPASMDEMKYDKSGACCVLGIAEAVAKAELPIRLRVYVALAENMPDGAAYRPGDIVTCWDGTTVEILNTDAEGRMVLADALAWAAKSKPDWMIDYATLTGAAVVALGEQAAALYASDDTLAEGLLAASEASGERLWRMPLWPEYEEQMKGHHGDLKNSGGRWGGSCTAAAFLSHFAGSGAWAHLDIAGPAIGQSPRTATGYGVASTFAFLRTLGGSR